MDYYVFRDSYLNCIFDEHGECGYLVGIFLKRKTESPIIEKAFVFLRANHVATVHEVHKNYSYLKL